MMSHSSIGEYSLQYGKQIESYQVRIQKQTHKYGIEVPKSSEHALATDRINCNHKWADAIDLERKNVAFAKS